MFARGVLWSIRGEKCGKSGERTGTFPGLEIRHIFRIYFLMLPVLGMGARRRGSTGGLECMHLIGL